MAKKTSPTDLKKVTEAAERIMENKSKIKELQEQMKQDMELVEKHALQTGERRYGKVQVYERNSSKLVLPGNLKEDEFADILRKRKLVGYTKLGIDKKAIIEATEDSALNEILDELSIEVTTESSLHLKYF